MKKLFAIVLTSLFLLSSFAFPVKASEPQSVQIPCQTVFGNTVADTVVHGNISNNTLYVSLETIAELTGAQYTVTESGKEIMLIFWEEITGNTHAFEFDLQTSTLKEINALLQDRTWEIPSLRTDNGDALVSLDHILAALNAEMKVDPTAQTPLVVHRPYTVLDAYTMIINNPTSLFSWADVDERLTEDDIKKYNQLSSITSLLMDYSSHLVTDGLFSWWNDDVLNVTEEQYQDTMIAILSCFSKKYPDITDSIDYETFSLHGKVDGIVNNMLDLFGIQDFSKIYKFSSTAISHAGILLEAFNNYYNYQQIANSELHLLTNAFLQNRPQTIFNEPDLKTIKVAAQHLQTLLEGGAESVLTQVAETLSEYGASVVSQLTPLALLEIATTITSLLPGMSEQIDQNNALMKATHCVVLDYLCRNEFVIQKDRLLSEGPTAEILSGMKDTLLFSLQASFCARNLLVQNNICTPKVNKQLQDNNVKTLEALLFLQGCSTEMVGDTVDYQYNKWDQYLEDVKSSQITDPIEAYTQALSNLRGASFTVKKSGEMDTDFVNHPHIRFTEEMSITEYGYYTMSGEGIYKEYYGDQENPSFEYEYTYDENGWQTPTYKGQPAEQVIPRYLLELDLPPAEALKSVSEISTSSNGKTFSMVYDGKPMTEENCGILKNIQPDHYGINWYKLEEDPSYNEQRCGVDQAVISVTYRADKSIDSIQVEYEVNGRSVQAKAGMRGTTLFQFGPVTAMVEDEPQPVEPEYSTMEQIYRDYLANREYQPYISDWDNGTPSEYALVDIDSNGIEEMILYGEGEYQYGDIAVFTYNEETSTVIALSCPDNYLVDNYSGYVMQVYGKPSYYPQYKAIHFSEESKPSVGQTSAFWTVNGNQLDESFRIMIKENDTGGPGWIRYVLIKDGIETEISNKEYNTFLGIQNLADPPVDESLEYKPIPVATSNDKIDISFFWGSWEADPNVTMALTGNSLMSIYGSGISNGSEIVIGEDGFFSFYIGITQDNQGEGTWEWNGNGFDYTLTSFLDQTEVRGHLTIEPYNGEDYLVMNDKGKKVYWKRSNPNTPLNQSLSYQMQTETFEFPLDDGRIYYSNEIRYPIFEGTFNVVNTINQYYSEIVDGYRYNDTDYDQIYQEALQWNQNVDEGMPYYDNLETEVTLFDINGAVAIKETYTMWSGGAHPYHEVKGINFDVTSGQMLTYEDILQGTSDQVDAVLRKYFIEAVPWYQGANDGTVSMAEILKYTSYTLTESGLCFYYNVGDAEGRQEITIPYTTTDSYLISAEELLSSSTSH